MFAAVLVTVMMAHAVDTYSSLFITFLDTFCTTKAFEPQMYPQRPPAARYRGKLYESSYTNIQSIVEWQGQLSQPFQEGQWTRQGGETNLQSWEELATQETQC